MVQECPQVVVTVVAVATVVVVLDVVGATMSCTIVMVHRSRQNK